ncbi:MAG: bifunctional DNA-formamidopyrimidine glycosylase/DNA-(apurinic or apyrimidinic site) lyase [Syntrophales bacterium]|jgi:formamidopyrimidine-DNA glycosylase
MPELPEVETLCRQLRRVIADREIISVEILDSRLGAVDGLVGKKITAVNRQGKAVEMRLDDDTRLLLHLRMTGKMQWQSPSQALPPHTRFTISFSHGRLLCIDTRRFATLAITTEGSLQALVKEPLLDFRTEELRKIARAKKLPVKSFLMDQRWIAGIGNIYACEILHEVSINPWRPVCGVSLREWRKIERVTKEILGKAIACRGTTVSDWRDLFGQKGEYQRELKVYDREGLPCLSCRGSIKRLRLSGRGTYFCPSCQKT